MLFSSKNKPTPAFQLIAPVLACLFLALMLLLHRLVPLGRLVQFPFSLAGLPLCGLGFVVCFAGRRQFTKTGTTLYPFSRPVRLVTSGLFRYSRNPMYLGLTLFLAGAWLFFGSVSPGVCVVAFLLITDRWYVPYEERQLLAVFGAEYAAYRSRTPRWI